MVWLIVAHSLAFIKTTGHLRIPNNFFQIFQIAVGQSFCPQRIVEVQRNRTDAKHTPYLSWQFSVSTVKDDNIK